MGRGPKKTDTDKKVTRYTYNEVREPRTPETGHTSLLPAEEQVVTLPMDNGWSKAVVIGKLPEDERPVIVDMDPAVDPTLFWAGKRNRRDVPILPLQRNEIVSESRIAQIIERARKASAEKEGTARQMHLFADLEKTLRESDRTKRVEFYTHEEGWKNKLICGDSLHVMESLLHYENLYGKVQMIYVDPPYGIKYDSNFQQRVDSTKNDEKDQADDVLTIRAFRDTWALGIHSYLSYLQERLYLCRELLTDAGSIFVQISLPNVHLVRVLCDEVFGTMNFVTQIAFRKTAGRGAKGPDEIYDVLVWYTKDQEMFRARWTPLYTEKSEKALEGFDWIMSAEGTFAPIDNAEQEWPEKKLSLGRRYCLEDSTSQGETEEGSVPLRLDGHVFRCTPGRHWRTTPARMAKLWKMGRLQQKGSNLFYRKFLDDFPYTKLPNFWDDTQMGGTRRSSEKVYVVQTPTRVVERCILMSTLPGDIVFDPTCGSGTTAVCAEKYGRRWLTCDTSRVAVNVSRARLLSLVFPHFKTISGAVRSGLIYTQAKNVQLETLAKDLEPATIDLVDKPVRDDSAIRVCGPYEVLSLGRYSIEDWKGSVVRESAAYGEPAKLENYIEVICRLYRKGAAIQGASGLVHAVAETEKEKIAISVGPLSGRVTCKQINDAVQDALASGILEVHVLGWAFEANVGEVKSALEKRGKVKVELIMIRPDTLAEGLKATQPEMLFSPLALPDIEVVMEKNGKEKQIRVTLKGVALFDRNRRTTEYKAADSGYVSAWYLDEDYDGDCFVDCQIFFDFKKTPNLKAALKAEVEPEEFTLKLTSEPFAVRSYKRIAAKVVDVYGNESTIVREIT
jgi:adenine-specific DNA-methyltransferase